MVNLSDIKGIIFDYGGTIDSHCDHWSEVIYDGYNAAGVILLVTPEGEKPQAEYGRAYLNGEQLPDIAPLSGITYRGHFQSVQIKLYLSLCVAAFLLMWFMVADTLLKNKYAGCIKESKPL